MAIIADSIVRRVKQALDVLARRVPVKGAYVFGSTVDGGSDQFSDIDVAVFVDEAHNLDIRQRAQAAADVQLEVGSDIEIHIFAAEMLTNPPPASFAAYIQSHGVRIDL